MLPSGLPLRYGYVLTVDKHPREPGKLLAIISDGSPQHGDKDVTVLTLEVVGSMKEAKTWFKWAKAKKPWVEAANDHAGN